jgi:threonine/homoserine/homoserine lactone efflux protein
LPIVGGVIVELLLLALGVMASPLAVMVVIVLLAGPGGRARAVAYVAGWAAGLLVVGGIVLVVVDAAAGAEPGDPGALGGVIKLVLGGVLLVLAARKWLGRPRAGERASLPGWMSSLETVAPGRALVLGATLAAVKPKNVALTVGAATTIADAGLGAGTSLALLVLYALLASLSVAAPLGVTLAMGPRAAATLEGWKAWLEANNRVLVGLVLLAFGVILAGQGIAALA